MAILLTAGTGKTSRRLSHILSSNNVPFLLASREGASSSKLPWPDAPATTFDWTDESTWENPFRDAEKLATKSSSAVNTVDKTALESSISNTDTALKRNSPTNAVYLVAASVQEPVQPMKRFIDFCVDKYGIKRFVLLAGQGIEKGGVHVGPVWAYLEETGLEFAVLRATWFMDNFCDQKHHASIKHEGKIYSAVADGKIPFTNSYDIARVAYHGLVDEKAPNAAWNIVGRELLTHDEVARKLSAFLGRTIVHERLTEEQSVQQQMKVGLPEAVAKMLAGMEVCCAKGMAEVLTEDVKHVTGKGPLSFDEWLQYQKGAWD
ncbi:MAG: hypothetical protein M1831_001517 [Alyxoria varia]|nr:MAG: hypothetical protein M1831_001517 [Alyxoria varia]